MNSLPDSDIELLSSYIDNQLGAPERAALERRLSAEPRLRAELDDLRATASLLRGLEPVRPPRSFTLDRAQARRRPSFLPLAWAMQLGGGLAGLALVLMASLQMIGGVGGSTAMAPAPPAAAMQAPAATQALPAAAMQAPAATEAPTISAAAAAAAAPVPMAAETMSTEAPADASDTVRQTDPAEATANASGGAAVPTADIAASGSSSPGTAALDPSAGPPATKVAPQPDRFPVELVFGLGVALLALAAGAFFYTRARR
jgi:hypothetical protein